MVVSNGINEIDKKIQPFSTSKGRGDCSGRTNWKGRKTKINF